VHPIPEHLTLFNPPNNHVCLSSAVKVQGQVPYKENAMTNTTLTNGRLSRKTLSSQIDRLDAMLDGLADNLNEAVAMAVKDSVAEVVRNAVEAAVKEVLSNPELLRAALGQHTPRSTPVQSNTATPQRRSFKDMLKGVWSWACKKVTQGASSVKKQLGQGLTWCVEKLRNGWAALRNGHSRLAACCVGTLATLGAVSVTLWRFRKSCSLALSVGLLAGVIGYFAGPIISSVLCGLSGVALSLSSMILLPLWRLLIWGTGEASD